MLKDLWLRYNSSNCLSFQFQWAWLNYFLGHDCSETWSTVCKLVNSKRTRLLIILFNLNFHNFWKITALGSSQRASDMAMLSTFTDLCKCKNSDSTERKNKHRFSKWYRQYLLSRKPGFSNLRSRLRGLTRAEHGCRILWEAESFLLLPILCQNHHLSPTLAAVLLETHI